MCPTQVNESGVTICAYASLLSSMICDHSGLWPHLGYARFWRAVISLLVLLSNYGAESHLLLVLLHHYLYQQVLVFHGGDVTVVYRQAGNTVISEPV